MDYSGVVATHRRCDITEASGEVTVMAYTSGAVIHVGSSMFQQAHSILPEIQESFPAVWKASNGSS